METQGKAATTHSAEDCACQAEIAAKAQAYGFSHADVLRALDAAGMLKFAVGSELLAELRALRQEVATVRRSDQLLQQVLEELQSLRRFEECRLICAT